MKGVRVVADLGVAVLEVRPHSACEIESGNVHA